MRTLFHKEGMLPCGLHRVGPDSMPRGPEVERIYGCNIDFPGRRILQLSDEVRHHVLGAAENDVSI